MKVALLFLTILGLALAANAMQSEQPENDVNDGEYEMYYEDGDQLEGGYVNSEWRNIANLYDLGKIFNSHLYKLKGFNANLARKIGKRVNVSVWAKNAPISVMVYIRKTQNWKQ